MRVIDQMRAVEHQKAHGQLGRIEPQRGAQHQSSGYRKSVAPPTIRNSTLRDPWPTRSGRGTGTASCAIEIGFSSIRIVDPSDTETL